MHRTLSPVLNSVPVSSLRAQIECQSTNKMEGTCRIVTSWLHILAKTSFICSSAHNRILFLFIWAMGCCVSPWIWCQRSFQGTRFTITAHLLLSFYLLFCVLVCYCVRPLNAQAVATARFLAHHFQSVTSVKVRLVEIYPPHKPDQLGLNIKFLRQ